MSVTGYGIELYRLKPPTIVFGVSWTLTPLPSSTYLEIPPLQIFTSFTESPTNDLGPYPGLTCPTQQRKIWSTDMNDSWYIHLSLFHFYTCPIDRVLQLNDLTLTSALLIKFSVRGGMTGRVSRMPPSDQGRQRSWAHRRFIYVIVPVEWRYGGNSRSRCSIYFVCG